MSDTPARKRIDKGRDISDGCGLPVEIAHLHVGKVSMLFDTINVIGSSVLHEEASIRSKFSVKLAFNAGYYISAGYWFNIKVTQADMVSLESQINAVQNLCGTVVIDEDPSEDLPFDNWFLVTEDAELLKEIESVNFSDDDSEPTRYEMEVGDAISFDEHWACSDVAYGLQENLNKTKGPFPYPETGFTKEFVDGFDQQLRDAICDVLRKSHELKTANAASNQ